MRKWNSCFLGLMALAMTPMTTSGTVVLYEPFDYGGIDIEDVTTLGGDTIGFTSSEKWAEGGGVADFDYLAAGMTFGSGNTTLATSGGLFDLTSVQGANGDHDTRGMNVALSGTIYGSYLWRITNEGSQSVAGLGLKSSADATSALLQADNYNSADKGVVVLFDAANVKSQVAASGTGWSTDGTTYIVLYELTNLGGTGDQTGKMWILTSDQFDYWKASGDSLTVEELDDPATATGTAANQVLQRVSVTHSGLSAFTMDDQIQLLANNAVSCQYDEIRISDTSLDEATPLGADTTPPEVYALDPQNDAYGVGLSTNLVITFNENVAKGVGNIVIRKRSDNSVVETIDVTSGSVTVSGTEVTIDPGADFAINTAYYVEIDDGAIVDDPGGNAFPGISGSTTWGFTTAPPPPIILYEPFDYGETNIEDIGGLGGSETGFTSTETWEENEGDADYVAAGLTFGTLDTAGGCFNHTSSGAHSISRGINITQTGQIWGSYLWRPISQPGNQVVNMVGIGDTYDIDDGTIQFASQGIRYNNNFKGGMSLLGSKYNCSGEPRVNDTTYLVLFTVTNLGGAGDQTIKQWMLTEAQFHYFKTSDDELTEAELDAASAGTAETDVFQKGTGTKVAGAQMLDSYYLVLFNGGNPVQADYDEIRISSTSLDAVTPVGGGQAGTGMILIVR